MSSFNVCLMAELLSPVSGVLPKCQIPADHSSGLHFQTSLSECSAGWGERVFLLLVLSSLPLPVHLRSAPFLVRAGKRYSAVKRLLFQAPCLTGD